MLGLPPNSPRFLPSAPAEIFEPAVGEAVAESLPELINEAPPEVPGGVPSGGAPVETSGPTAGVGFNFAFGFLSSAINKFFAPEREAAQQQGTVALMVTQGIVVTTAFLVSRSAPCERVAGVIGSAMQSVPVVGQGYLGAFVQTVVGAQLGEYVGQKLSQLRQTAVGTTSGRDNDGMFEIYVSDTCVVCQEGFGNGAHRVAALDCGHACLCYDQGCAAWRHIPCSL